MKNKKRLIIYLFVVLVLIGIFELVSIYISKPGQGTIVQTKTSPYEVPAVKLVPTLFTSPYVSFSYPSILKKDLANKPINPVVDEYLFSYIDIESWNLAITIYSIPGGAFSDNNAYQVRKAYPTKYLESTQVVNGQNVFMFSDQTISSYNKVAFLLHGSYQATISLSGDDPSGQVILASTLTMILSTWAWKH